MRSTRVRRLQKKTTPTTAQNAVVLPASFATIATHIQNSQLLEKANQHIQKLLAISQQSLSSLPPPPHTCTTRAYLDQTSVQRQDAFVTRIHGTHHPVILRLAAVFLLAVFLLGSGSGLGFFISVDIALRPETLRGRKEKKRRKLQLTQGDKKPTSVICFFVFIRREESNSFVFSFSKKINKLKNAPVQHLQVHVRWDRVPGAVDSSRLPDEVTCQKNCSMKPSTTRLPGQECFFSSFLHLSPSSPL